MIGRIKDNNGTKEIEWIAGRADGQGVPIGCLVAIYGNTAPNASWLICDGSTFDENTYPALALYLGGNRLPDLRECVLVGAGQSDNDYNASTNPNGIHAHDVYTVGEFKDDQMQGHRHNYTKTSQTTVNFGGAPFNYGALEGADTTSNPVNDGTNGEPRVSTTTHGKQVGVNYIIKATSVSAETDHAAILAQTMAYVRDQNELSNYESISLPSTQETAITMQYDGVLFLYDNLNYYAGIRISQDGGVSWKGLNVSSGYNQFMFELVFNKGDMIYLGEGGRNAYVAYYKKRDYSNR